MNDIFIEQMVKRKQTKKILALKGLLYTITTLLILLSLLIPYFGVILAVVLVWGAYNVHTFFNIEYEYVMTAGDFDIDRIINKSRRKKVVGFQVTDIQILAPASTKEHQNELGNYQRVIDCSSGVLTDKTYVMMVIANQEKIKIYFEPNEKMIKAIKSKVPRRVFDH